jgi:Holliday junction resolvase RusA-like endonuclease
MTEIQFSVKGIPPIKSSNQSIWSLDAQAERLLKLRFEALRERKRQQITQVFDTPLSLEFEIFAPLKDLNTIGDLDNMIGGICDGLQAKPNNPTLVPHDIFLKPEMQDISPEKPILYTDDSLIRKIFALKTEFEKEIYYTVTIIEL